MNPRKLVLENREAGAARGSREVESLVLRLPAAPASCYFESA